MSVTGRSLALTSDSIHASAQTPVISSGSQSPTETSPLVTPTEAHSLVPRLLSLMETSGGAWGINRVLSTVYEATGADQDIVMGHPQGKETGVGFQNKFESRNFGRFISSCRAMGDTSGGVSVCHSIWQQSALLAAASEVRSCVKFTLISKAGCCFVKPRGHLSCVRPSRRKMYRIPEPRSRAA